MASAALHSPSSTSQLPFSTGGFLHATAHCGVALRIQVNQQHTALRRRQRGSEIDGGGGLAHPALLLAMAMTRFIGRSGV